MRRVPCPICDGRESDGCGNCGGVGIVEETPTMFRTFPDGGVVALFPAIPADPVGRCSSYMQVGQHGAADYWHVISNTRPASPDGYRDLMFELTGIGYAVRPVRRASRRMHDQRQAELHRLLSSHVSDSVDR